MKKTLLIVFLGLCLLSIASFTFADVTLTNPLVGVNNFTTLITNISQYIINFIVAPLTALIFVIAGIMFVTSAGNEARISHAKKAAIYAAVGAAIALAGTGLIAIIKQVIGA